MLTNMTLIYGSRPKPMTGRDAVTIGGELVAAGRQKQYSWPLEQALKCRLKGLPSGPTLLLTSKVNYALFGSIHIHPRAYIQTISAVLTSLVPRTKRSVLCLNIGTLWLLSCIDWI